MGLSLLDCVVGTIVDHRYERFPDGKERVRPKVRRGIIVKVEGEASSTGGVPAVWVKFSKPDAAERVGTEELSRFLPARARVAREAYRRIMGVPKMIGVVEQTKVRERPVMVDELALTPAKNAGPVSEEEEPLVAGMEDEALGKEDDDT